jgi:hypothetical protein
MAANKPPAPRRYAEDTTVPVDRSQEEARRLLRRYRAEAIRFTEMEDRAALEFQLQGWVIRFLIQSPADTEHSIRYTKSGVWRSEVQREAAIRQEYQRRWRSLILRLKAKLESVASNDVAVQEEFLPYIVTHADQTVAEWLLPQLEEVKRTGRMPELLPPAAIPLPPLREIEAP